MAPGSRVRVPCLFLKLKLFARSTFIFFVNLNSIGSLDDILYVTLFDHDPGTPNDDVLGGCEVTVRELFEGKEGNGTIDETLELELRDKKGKLVEGCALFLKADLKV